MELTAVPTMESANAPQDGLAFTVHSVSDFCYPFSVYKSVIEFPFSTVTLYSLISSCAPEPFLIQKVQHITSMVAEESLCKGTGWVLAATFRVLFKLPSEEDSFWLQPGIHVEEFCHVYTQNEWHSDDATADVRLHLQSVGRMVWALQAFTVPSNSFPLWNLTKK